MLSKHRFILIIAGLFLLGAALPACRMGRDYQRPSLGLPATYQTSGTDTVTAADIPWKDFFQDSTLRSLIDTGLAYNNDLQAALQRLEAAGALARQARLNWLPTLDLGVGAQSSRPSDNSLDGLSTSSILHKRHVEDYNAYASFSWELDVWGKIKRAKEATLADYLRTFQATRAVRTRLVAEIATGYYNLLMLDEQLATARRNLALGDSTLTLTLLEQKAGQVTRLAVQQASAQRQATREIIPQLETKRSVQQNALRLLTGSYPGPVSSQTRLSSLKIRDSLETGIPAAMISRRPDVRQSELELVAANARVGVARANLYPSLRITATGGLNTFTASNWFNIPASLFGLAAGTLTEPVFRHKQLKTQWEVAKADRQAQVFGFRQSVLTAVGEVSDALVTLNKLDELDSLTEERARTLEGAVRNAQWLFTSGMANYLEIITAQQNALQAQLDLADVKRQRLDAVVTLYQALGGGWK